MPQAPGAVDVQGAGAAVCAGTMDLLDRYSVFVLEQIAVRAYVLDVCSGSMGFALSDLRCRV